MLDGEGWNYLEIIDPDGFTILELTAKEAGSIGTQGLTEFFFESAKPSFEGQTLAELFLLFPEGEYEFEGTTTEGDSICGTAELTHNLPGIPEPNVDADDDGEARVCWDEVEDPFDDRRDPPADVGDEIEIDMYRVVVEALDEEGEGLETLDVELPASGRCLSIPPEFLALSPAGEFKFEVIATEESGNQTIFEGEFELEDVDDDDDCRRGRRNCGRR
jgi:hypothetical protein